MVAKFYIFQKPYFTERWRFAISDRSSNLGLLIVCKFEEWKKFAQFLVGKPILPKKTV